MKFFCLKMYYGNKYMFCGNLILIFVSEFAYVSTGGQHQLRS